MPPTRSGAQTFSPPASPIPNPPFTLPPLEEKKPNPPFTLPPVEETKPNPPFTLPPLEEKKPNPPFTLPPVDDTVPPRVQRPDITDPPPDESDLLNPNANQQIRNTIIPTDAFVISVEIAPVTAPGSSVPGTWTQVYGAWDPPPMPGIYDAIRAQAGIGDCSTTWPQNLTGAPGFIEYTGRSRVLNSGAQRASFGYFIRYTTSTTYPASVEYFALFSFDKIVNDGVPLCATEFFLFGPVVRDASGNAVSPLPLVLGLAIDNNGNLLGAVPKELANVNNFLGEGDEAVRPGVLLPGTGCMRCHGPSARIPNRTRPFPWSLFAATPQPPPRLPDLPPL